MKLPLKLLTTALLTVSVAPAFAAGDDADLYSFWGLYNLIYVGGDVQVDGRIRVNSESGALVDQDQLTDSNTSLGDGDNDAFAEDSAMQDATGNIGANIASGVGNAQANDVALSAVDGQNVFASAQVFNSQTTHANFGNDGGNHNNVFYTAYATDHVLQNASGNIGLNIAAGVGNAQTNAMAASVNTSGTIAKASADSEQFTRFNEALAENDLDNTAYLSGSALSGAMGNIGVNIAAGVGNAQHNGLSIAVASGGGGGGGGGGGCGCGP